MLLTTYLPFLVGQKEKEAPRHTGIAPIRVLELQSQLDLVAINPGFHLFMSA